MRSSPRRRIHHWLDHQHWHLGRKKLQQERCWAATAAIVQHLNITNVPIMSQYNLNWGENKKGDHLKQFYIPFIWDYCLGNHKTIWFLTRCQIPFGGRFLNNLIVSLSWCFPWEVGIILNPSEGAKVNRMHIWRFTHLVLTWNTLYAERAWGVLPGTPALPWRKGPGLHPPQTLPSHYLCCPACCGHWCWLILERMWKIRALKICHFRGVTHVIGKRYISNCRFLLFGRV